MAVDLNRTWHGDEPFCLLIATPPPPLELDGVGIPLNPLLTVIDIEEPQWATTYAHLMRAPGEWYLTRKSDGSVELAIHVNEGEQPYYVKRHIGVATVSDGVKHEIAAYGLGKKRRDGHTDRLWLLSNGLRCGGDDVDHFAGEALKHL